MSAPSPENVIVGEHALIAEALTFLEVVANQVKQASTPPKERLQELLGFLRDFADLGHHEKEESVLFPALSHAGVDWSSEPLRQIRADHRQERYLLRSLLQLAKQEREWSLDDRLHFHSIAEEFVNLQRQHMAREAQYIVPMLREKLSAEFGEQVMAGFAAVDREINRDAQLERLERLKEEFAQP